MSKIWTLTKVLLKLNYADEAATKTRRFTINAKPQRHRQLSG
ncbi:hypothetical protein ACT7CZ_08695 [Bacillus cereus]